jgi:MFS family permease
VTFDHQGQGQMANTTESAAAQSEQSARRARPAPTEQVEAHIAARAEPPQPTPLPTNRALRGIYTGTFTAFIGLAMAEVVFPLLVLGFTGKPVLAGLFGMVQFTALVLASVPVGNFVDRHDRRRVLIAGETIRASVATVLAVTLAAGHVWLVEVYIIAFVLGVCQPLSAVRTLALRSVAAPAQLTKALSVQQIVGGIAQLIGPAVGTMLYTINRSLPFAAIAAGVGISALCAYIVRFDSMPTPAGAEAKPIDGVPPEADGNTKAESESPLVGIRIIWAHPVMRGTMLFVMLLNLIGVPLDLVLIIQAKHEGVPTHYIGLILASFAAGGVLGAPCVPKLHALLQPGQLLIALGLLITLACAMIGLFPLGGFWMAGWLAAIGFAVPAAEVLIDILVLRQVPDQQRGRVLSAVMTFAGLGLPIGAALGGSLLQVISAKTFLIGAAVATAGVLLFAISQRALRISQWPPAH